MWGAKKFLENALLGAAFSFPGSRVRFSGREHCICMPPHRFHAAAEHALGNSADIPNLAAGQSEVIFGRYELGYHRCRHEVFSDITSLFNCVSILVPFQSLRYFRTDDAE